MGSLRVAQIPTTAWDNMAVAIQLKDKCDRSGGTVVPEEGDLRFDTVRVGGLPFAARRATRARCLHRGARDRAV